MCSCIIKNCQYDNFFDSQEFIQDKKLFYVKDSDSLDEYCLFHAPEEVKEKFTYYQNELLKKTILDYIDFCIEEKQTIDFSKSIFHIPFEINDLKDVITIDFTETIFVEYFRMDNLECKEIIFQDTEFHDGGGIKNRNGNQEVQIENLIFRPYQLESDFVIDIGKYANDMGRIESNHYGVIKKIKFENHKKGKGIVYFIGFNEYVEEANFRNMILDYVSFQNCDLSKCYFLNAKMNEVEFRNCKFPSNFDNLYGFVVKFGVSALGVSFASILINKKFELASIIFTLIFFILIIFIGFIMKGKHSCIADEKYLKNKDFDTHEAIEKIYMILKEKFSKFDFQTGGDFFYSQRLLQIESSENKLSTILYGFHYVINGFGEKYIRPLLMIIFIITYFSLLYYPNKDFQSTPVTPQFLFTNNIDTKNIFINENPYKVLVIKDEEGTKNIKKYYSRKFIDFPKSSDGLTLEKRLIIGGKRLYISFIYSSNQFISPFTNKNRTWFKTVSKKATILNIIETILLYLFFGAFILAVKNRIKR